MQEDFKYIEGLKPQDAIQLVTHYEAIAHLLPGLRCETDALLVLRNLKSLDQFGSIEALKAGMIEVDEDWRQLVEDMDLSDEFQKEHQESIIRFLCCDGAHIARTYQACLEGNLQKAYQRVVKAELMGKLHELKYFEGDL